MSDATFPRTAGLLGPIFEESSKADRAMREALFLTFNVDLGFFEDRVLGPTRATGAAVTVIADAGVFAPDPRAVRSAGRTYTLGLAHHAGAFHPKLTVLAGPERALIGIGSGNLTIGGWHANDEVLTTIRASRADGTPVVVQEIVAFLQRLPEVVSIGSLATQGILRTAAALQRLVETSERVDTPHRLAHSLAGPIMAQLPSGPADALELAAPFHDEHGHAMTELVARYRPRHITVLAQPGRAVMQPNALLSAAGTGQLRFTQLDGEPATTTAYRHGKVLSAHDADGRLQWSLTGSPNLTAAALLRAASDPTAPGNCELGVLTFAGVSLLPAPTVDVVDLPSLDHRLSPVDGPEDDGTSSSVGISEAQLTADGLLVVLSGTARSDVVVMVSPYREPPEQLMQLGVIPSGQDRGVFPGEFEPGTRVHAGMSVHFVADPDQVENRLRPASGHATNSNTAHAELFASEALAQQWQKTLSELVLSHRPDSAGIATGSVVAGASDQRQAGAWRTLDDDSAWNDYLSDAQNALGLPMFLLAAGPAAIAPVGAALPKAALAWEDRFEETVDTFEEEQTAETLEVDGEAAATHQQQTAVQPMSPGQRRYYRSWLARLADMVGILGPVEAIAATQLIVVGAGAQCWDGDRGPTGWFDSVHAAVSHLVRDDWPARLAAQAASVLAIGLYRLRQAAPTEGRGRESRMLQDLAAAAAEMLNDVREDLLDDNIALLDGAHVVAPSASDIIDDVLDLMSDAPDSTLLSQLGRAFPDLDATWTGPQQLFVRGSTGNPSHTAARVLDLADGFETLAVMVEDPRGLWALLAVADNKLTIVTSKGTVRYTTHTLGPLATPLSLVTDSERLQRSRISRPPFNTPGTAELAVFERARVDTLPLPDDARAMLDR